MDNLYKKAKEKIDEIENKLNNATFIKNNYAFLFNIAHLYKEASEDIKDSNDRNIKKNLDIYVSWEESLSFVREYLYDISSEIGKKFDESLYTMFTFVDAKDESDTRYASFCDNCSINLKEDDDYEFHRGINIFLEGNVSDAATIIHEFFHQLNDHDKNNYGETESRALLTEAVSIYFENDFLKKIAKKNSDYTNDVNKLILSRYVNTRKAAVDMENYYYVMYIFDKIGYLNDNTFNDLEALNIIRPDEEYFELIIKDFINSSYSDYYKGTSYILGTLCSLNLSNMNNYSSIMLKLNNMLLKGENINKCLHTIRFDNLSKEVVTNIKENIDEVKNNCVKTNNKRK